MTEALENMLQVITENMDRAKLDWQSMSMVVGINGDFLGRTYGYLYTGDSPLALTTVSPFVIAEATLAYLATKYEEPAVYPVYMLVQPERATGKFQVTFEDTDSKRWAVTPENHEEVRERVRPRFE
ncbi:hypothetical protein JOF28_000607 [Leucobacter exalbidus]|uniref:Uncharacterized protein n=1 Tax=Leucobacter exalbidus TaxID=662960 RepID=A0A940PLL7_9MICO|nr:hypothetical protein [Leucobacter exalbidus]MBP1325375.1 hypothetical protein [Leucobacter exalbidus]